jgi:hypothetical protein
VSDPDKKIADRVVRLIVRDLSDRRGLAQEWRQIEPDIKAEIEASWTGIVLRALRKRAK